MNETKQKNIRPRKNVFLPSLVLESEWKLESGSNTHLEHIIRTIQTKTDSFEKLLLPLYSSSSKYLFTG